jgi:hypothetical protein
MNNYQTFQLAPDFTVSVAPYSRGFTLSDHDKLLIENIWRNELLTRPTLFNGQILNVLDATSSKIEGVFIDYKYYLASEKDPRCKELLNIKPLSISGLTTAGDKVLIGLRSLQVTDYPDFFESVPSGGIDPRALIDDRIDIHKQFQLELWEETKISVTDVKNVILNGLAYDKNLDRFELYATLQISYTILKEELEPGVEYKSLKWISKSELPAFVKKNQEQIVPFSLYLLQRQFHFLM